MIEMMDAAYWEAFDSFNGKTSEDAMRAALSVLARPQNITDAMVEAFKDKMEPYTDGSGFNYKAALAAAISAAGDEDRRA